jgi:phosphopantothenoylcysteine decarboxylase/phosphopantothenate--cysteine ligase
VRFLPVGEGRTACGETGEGRLAEPAEIAGMVEAALARPVRRLRVLVTSGGTTEPIDGVRVLTNTSTGSTGAGIASHLVGCGHEAVLLRARRAQRPEAPCREEIFETFADLEAALSRLLRAERFDAVIHAAAVGDFGVEAVLIDGQVYPVGGAKIDSRRPPLLRLKANPKLVERIRGLSPTPLKLVAFKLTSGATADEAGAAVQRLFAQGAPDYVVHNDLAARGASLAAFPADIHARRGGDAVHCATRFELSVALEKLLILSTP